MTNLKNKTAFSLIELSIVILIIGIIVAGITQSSRLIRQFKLSSARSQTQSGPVSSIKDLGAWFETTLPSSFIDGETEDAASATTTGITVWNDINSASSFKRDASAGASGNRPLYYANCMNGLPCLRFDGSNDELLFDGTFLVGVDYTIFVVEQRRIATARYFLGNKVAATTETALQFGYSGTSALEISQGSTTNYYTAAIDAFGSVSPKLHTFVNSTIASGITSGITTSAHYLNGSATASTLTSVGSPSLGTLTAYDDATIGSTKVSGTSSYFNGDIGEIIFYTRALKAEERISVEDYLLKKWNIAGL